MHNTIVDPVQIDYTTTNLTDAQRNAILDYAAKGAPGHGLTLDDLLECLNGTCRNAIVSDNLCEHSWNLQSHHAFRPFSLDEPSDPDPRIQVGDWITSPEQEVDQPAEAADVVILNRMIREQGLDAVVTGRRYTSRLARRSEVLTFRSGVAYNLTQEALEYLVDTMEAVEQSDPIVVDVTELRPGDCILSVPERTVIDSAIMDFPPDKVVMCLAWSHAEERAVTTSHVVPQRVTISGYRPGVYTPKAGR